MTAERTLLDRLSELARREPALPAFHEREAPGTWRTLTWGEVHAGALEIAGGLIELGVEPGEPVGLLGDNRADFVLFQLGVLAAGGVPTPVYTTSTAEQIGYVLAHAGVRCLAADSPERLARAADGARAAGAPIAHAVDLSPSAAPGRAGARSLAELRVRGRSHRAAAERRMAERRGDELALLVYTSGTTGRPKGVELTHAAIARTSEEVVALMSPALEGERFRVVSYLPLSHIAEQMMSALTPVWFAGEIFFCPQLEALREVLPEARPTVFLGVPRVWEKLEGAIRAKLAAATGAKARLASWAVATELAAFERGLASGQPARGAARALARRVVLDKIHAALGFDRLRYALSGAAPICRSTLDFFAALGLPIHDVYGMTETTALISATRPGRFRFGSVGPPLDCGSLRIAEDGEILYRGPNLCRGYRGDPAATAELVDPEGWLHTGDLGSVDADGYLFVTGRKKELLITAGGKNVAPAEVEPLLTALPGVGQAVLVGDRRPYLCALIALDPLAAPALARELGLASAEPAELARDPRVHDHLMAAVERQVNPRLAAYQTVKRIALLERELSIEGGELTPTLKLRRSVIAAKYTDTIEALYAPSAPDPRRLSRSA